MSEKAYTSVIIESIKNIPQIRLEINATLVVSSFLFSIGEIKKRKNKPLNAKILLAPARNTLSMPFPIIGRGFSILNKSITNMDVTKMLASAIGTIIVFDLIIDLLPNKFATTATNKSKNTIKEIG